MIRNTLLEVVNPRVTLIPNGAFPLYLIHGDQNYLVDCGVAAHGPKIAAALERFISRFDGPGSRKIDSLLLTHTHYDHVGGLSYLQDRFHFKVYSSGVGVNLLKKSKVTDFINHLNREYDNQNGIKDHISFHPPRYLRSLAEGDRLKIDRSHTLEVLETPGHTRCSLSFYLVEDKILFPGDSVGVAEKNGAIKPLFLSSYRSYIDSLDKLAGLDAEVLCLAHNRYLRGSEKVRQFFQRSRHSAQAFKERILDGRDSPKELDIEEMAGEILDEAFPRPTVMGPREALMINVMAMIKAVLREFPA